ncbi:hypothetical protein APY04_0124 [Hyphomicrobium sulfonivorans]|uniref:Uncharacterized protein n=1 Tax=Hyphomicrobium sulfonivorans TaxID=121290 RepID=A0A120CYC7_HYPSL|nr:hypothetical protein APY04_0124 [Hyphomicrobium sulfonivorans]
MAAPKVDAVRMNPHPLNKSSFDCAANIGRPHGKASTAVPFPVGM